MGGGKQPGNKKGDGRDTCQQQVSHDAVGVKISEGEEKTKKPANQ